MLTILSEVHMKSLTKSLLLFTFLIGPSTLFAQSNSEYLYWSSTHKLTVSDFAIKTSDGRAGAIAAQYYFSYEVNGLDFMTKNFNKKVHNCILRSASWIDTTYDVRTSLRYQQTLFDLAEIYARHFRRDLRDNRKKLLKGTDFVKELSTKSMTDFSKRQIEYVSDTQFGNNEVMQQAWEQRIQRELVELKEFAVEEN